MNLSDKVRETRFKFNETSRRYLGNWSTRDAQYLIDSGINAGAIYGVLTALPDSSLVETAIGLFGALFSANLVLINPLRKYMESKIRKDEEKYIRLVGLNNALNHGSLNMRSFIRENQRLPLSGKIKVLDDNSYVHPNLNLLQ